MNSSIKNGSANEESSAAIATAWMGIADLDGSGTIDIEEFKEFIVKLDSSIEADTIQAAFDGQDEAKDGELPVENFGKALFEIVKDMKADE